MTHNLRVFVRNDIIHHAVKPIEPYLIVLRTAILTIMALALYNMADQWGNVWRGIGLSMLIGAGALHVYNCCIASIAEFISNHDPELPFHCESDRMRRRQLMKFFGLRFSIREWKYI